MSNGEQTTPDYDLLLDLVKRRVSHRKLKPDPIPDEHIQKILEVGRWAMSGANSQPWEFIVVKDPQVKKDMFKASKENGDFGYWMEQQRLPELRHPALQMVDEREVQRQRRGVGWSEAPALIVVLGDGRRQWGTILSAHTFGRHQTHLTDGLANACMLMHVAATSLGLGTQWCSVHIQEPIKRVLGVPDILLLHTIMPIGYPAVEPLEGVRRDLDQMVHCERYDKSKFMSGRQIFEYLLDLRRKTIPVYRKSYTDKADAVTD